jgi:hypothetical protein
MLPYKKKQSLVTIFICPFVSIYLPLYKRCRPLYWADLMKGAQGCAIRILYFHVRWLQLNSVVKAVASALELVFTALLSVPILGKMIDCMSYRILYENILCVP